MKVTLEIPDRVWWRLVDAAEKQGKSTSELMSQVATGITHPDPIERLHTIGYTDAEIAAQTGLLLRTVAERRRRLGLPPNKRTSKREIRRAA
ncbi:hypothetical protein [Paramicrobacterium chengjingii]|uniref:hypothetical protein n=1 Tax=Paramicrobacterium chengjingii TaxID=2769067 RepID=UPI0014231683|nr:hypothetical protein [Microbacterium chengjingii]